MLISRMGKADLFRKSAFEILAYFTSVDILTSGTNGRYTNYSNKEGQSV